VTNGTHRTVKPKQRTDKTQRVYNASKKVSKKGKGSQYLITERRVPELIPVLGSQPAGDLSHKPGYHYFPPGPQPLRGLLPVLLLGKQRHDGCEQFA